MDDPKLREQAEATDFEEHQEVDAGGRPLAIESSQEQLTAGVELEDDPWDVHKEGHPTPDRPSGRLEP